MSNSYYDAKEFAAQAAKPLRATIIRSGETAVAIVPPLATANDVERLKAAVIRTRHLEQNGGMGMRS